MISEVSVGRCRTVISASGSLSQMTMSASLPGAITPTSPARLTMATTTSVFATGSRPDPSIKCPVLDQQPRRRIRHDSPSYTIDSKVRAPLWRAPIRHGATEENIPNLRANGSGVPPRDRLGTGSPGGGKKNSRSPGKMAFRGLFLLWLPPKSPFSGRKRQTSIGEFKSPFPGRTGTAHLQSGETLPR